MSITKNNTLHWHLLAAAIVGIWGATFVNTKVLFNSGLTPLEIFVLRFISAYVCIWFISPRKLFSKTWRDELIMVLLGITGGSVFFLAENYAVGLTYVNNVSFIVCTAPLMTVILGSVIALLGVAIVIFNGSLVLHLNPWGDLLALLASVCWAVYSLLMKRISHQYSAVFITRKIFFYGLLTVLPAFLFDPRTATSAMLFTPKVVLNLLFLGLIASFLCFVLWTLVIAKIGAMTSSNYLYLNPISTVVISAFVLDEPMTAIAYVGSALILAGVIISNK